VRGTSRCSTSLRLTCARAAAASEGPSKDAGRDLAPRTPQPIRGSNDAQDLARGRRARDPGSRTWSKPGDDGGHIGAANRDHEAARRRGPDAPGTALPFPQSAAAARSGGAEMRFRLLVLQPPDAGDYTPPPAQPAPDPPIPPQPPQPW
jgi:hypothetical protein